MLIFIWFCIINILEIGDVAGCAEATITQTYRAMHPRAAELFPDDVRLALHPEKFPP